MLTDRYGLSVSTVSAAARDAYVEGCDLLMTVYPGAAVALERAIAADPASLWPISPRRGRDNWRGTLQRCGTRWRRPRP